MRETCNYFFRIIVKNVEGVRGPQLAIEGVFIRSRLFMIQKCIMGLESRPYIHKLVMYFINFKTSFTHTHTHTRTPSEITVNHTHHTHPHTLTDTLHSIL